LILTLPVIIALVGLAVGGLRLGWVLWKGARASAIERWAGEQLLRVKLQAQYLYKKYTEISEQPDKEGDDLTDSLNDKWRG